MKTAQRKKLERELGRLCKAPPPKNREEFLQRLGQPQLSMGEFLWIQAGYIQKGTFGASALLFFLLLYLMADTRFDPRSLWAASACVPFLSMLAVAEGGRSRRFAMEELELAAPFSLRTIWMARTGLLGFLNLAVLLLGAPLVWGWGKQTAVQTGVFLLAPYLLSAFLNLFVQRRLRQRTALPVGAGLTLFVSALSLTAGTLRLSPDKLIGALPWELLLPILAALVGRECYRTAKETEEYVWSLS